MTPSEAQEIVPHACGGIAHGRPVLDAECAVALGQLLAVFSMDQRHVSPDGRFPSHGTVDEHLPGRVVQVVVASDDVGDAHVVIVDDDGQHVDRRSVGPEHDHVVELFVPDRDNALNPVLNPCHAIVGGPYPDCVWRIRVIALRRFPPWRTESGRIAFLLCLVT